MIDIHCHILPGVDDGPKDWDAALNLLRAAEADGTTGMVATSHVVDRLDTAMEKLYTDVFTELKGRAAEAGIGLKLWLAGEVHCQTAFAPTSPLATFNHNGKYLLVELPMAQVPADFKDLIFNLELEGIVPILAHPERNAVLMQKPAMVHDWIERGILMQINAGSLLGRFGRPSQQMAVTMLDHNWVHFVASDAHSTRSRPPGLSEAYAIIEKKYGRHKAQALFLRHPLAAVEGGLIEIGTPLPLKKRRGLKAFFATAR